MWSPEPVVGYRVWSVRHDRIEGSRTVWRTPAADAICDNPHAPQPLPHVGTRCACGIYAAKDLGWLHREFPGIGRRGVAVGRVRMTGRVVEHTHGYRAQHATVTEIVVGTDTGLVHLTDPEDIAGLFDNPAGTLAHSPRVTAETPEEALTAGGTPWT